MLLSTSSDVTRRVRREVELPRPIVEHVLLELQLRNLDLSLHTHLEHADDPVVVLRVILRSLELDRRLDVPSLAGIFQRLLELRDDLLTVTVLRGEEDVPMRVPILPERGEDLRLLTRHVAHPVVHHRHALASAPI